MDLSFFLLADLSPAFPGTAFAANPFLQGQVLSIVGAASPLEPHFLFLPLLPVESRFLEAQELCLSCAQVPWRYLKALC